MDNNVEVINVAYDKWMLRASEGSLGPRLCGKGDTKAAVALCLCTLGRAGLLISAQGYINDVSTVAAIHHAERRFSPRWSRPSVSREKAPLAGEFRDERRKEERGMEMHRRHNIIVVVVVVVDTAFIIRIIITEKMAVIAGVSSTTAAEPAVIYGNLQDELRTKL